MRPKKHLQTEAGYAEHLAECEKRDAENLARQIAQFRERRGPHALRDLLDKALNEYEHKVS